MVDITVTLNGNEYRRNLDSSFTKFTIEVSDCSNIIVNGDDGWYSYKVKGNEISFIVDGNLSDTDREGGVCIYSSMYPERKAYFTLIQKGEEFSLSSNVMIKDDMSPLINGEDITFNITVKGGNRKCCLKEIREYQEIDTDEYIRIPFDNALSVKLNDNNDGTFFITIHNNGKITEEMSHYKVVIAHDDNPSTTLEIRLSYKNLADTITVSPSSIIFSSNGYSANHIIKVKGNHLDNIEDNVSNSLDWLHIICGYDCIYVYADSNENEIERNGNITVYGNPISIQQKRLSKGNTISAYNDDFSVVSIEDGILYKSGIDDVTIEDNAIRLQTNTLENGNYVHDSMITVELTGKWADFTLDYDNSTEKHLVTIIANENPFDTERKCLLIIRNAENTEASRRFLVVQSPLSKDVKLSFVD